MPFVKINGKRLFYTIDGDSGTGATTLFIHGLGSSSCFFYSIIPGLKSFTRCVALDLPGSGQSELGKSELSIASVIEDAIVLLDTLNIKDKVVLVGHSVGCTLVDYLAATYPDRVRAVVLLGPLFPHPAMVPLLEERINIVKNGMLNLLTSASLEVILRVLTREQTVLRGWLSQFLRALREKRRAISSMLSFEH